MSSFGFTFLSRQELAQADKLIFDDGAGVRDEVGFLIVHQRYSDRFFPGTSVLQTRLRYALLIPWIYETIRERASTPKDYSLAVAELEHRLTNWLRPTEAGGESNGVIGGTIYPKRPSQPASAIYWTALTKWGLINPRPNKKLWSRADMARLFKENRARAPKDDDGQPLEPSQWPFPQLPKRPKNWSTNEKMTLELTQKEAKFLSKKLSCVLRPDNTGEPSLLARLVGKNIGAAKNCWDPSILRLSGSEKKTLVRAGQAAALSAIGRAVYSALVETMKNEKDRHPETIIHRDILHDTVCKWGSQASKLNEEEFHLDMNGLPGPVEEMLHETLVWIRKDGNDPISLHEVYSRAEYSRKGNRARLADNQFGADRRVEWQADMQQGKAEPLHYRWGNVKRLLHDISDVL